MQTPNLATIVTLTLSVFACHAQAAPHCPATAMNTSSPASMLMLTSGFVAISALRRKRS